ncbi:hypothetical protein PR048_019521 [Dryococelus australis]|uniref:Nucleotide exchange factor SIL1 n=1 Tax=Dryococelus australis TaxID=614101 RepID=A0ABQ9H419_9NEOP|nr:hypothetical protein PR048_019521 [Dryococelus australis]
MLRVIFRLLDVIFPSLNSSSAAVRAEAALVVGSAVQSNPKVQISMLEGGGISILLRLIALDPDAIVRSRGVYALSCLVRRFPTAQTKLVRDGGLSALATLFSSERQEDLKLQVKVVTLLRDLIMERLEAEKLLAEGDTEASPDAVEKVRQYKLAGLEEKLVQTGWCERLPRLLYAQSSSKSRTGKRDDLSSAITKQLSVRPEHDVVEKVVGAIQALSELCADKFGNDATLYATLVDLKLWYNDLASLEQSDSHAGSDSEDQLYFTKLSKLLLDVISKLQISYTKDEL